jgi:hypothetical protein
MTFDGRGRDRTGHRETRERLARDTIKPRSGGRASQGGLVLAGAGKTSPRAPRLNVGWRGQDLAALGAVGAAADATLVGEQPGCRRRRRRAPARDRQRRAGGLAATRPWQRAVWRARIQQAQQNAAVMEALGVASASRRSNARPTPCRTSSRVTKNGPSRRSSADRQVGGIRAGPDLRGRHAGHREWDAGQPRRRGATPVPTARYARRSTPSTTRACSDLRLGSPEAMTRQRSQRPRPPPSPNIEKQITDAQALKLRPENGRTDAPAG